MKTHLKFPNKLFLTFLVLKINGDLPLFQGKSTAQLAGWMPERIDRWSVGVGRRYLVTMRKASFKTLSMRRAYALSRDPLKMFLSGGHNFQINSILSSLSFKYGSIFEGTATRASFTQHFLWSTA